MADNLRTESSSTSPVKSLIKSVSVKLVSEKIPRSDFDSITTMVKNSINAFDKSIETTSGQRFSCSVVINLESTY